MLCAVGTGARVVLLGRLGIESTGDAADRAALPGGSAEPVFAHLVLARHRGVTPEELVDLLWPDALPDSWTAALRGVVSGVRRCFEQAGLDGDGIVASERGGWALRLPDGVSVDIEEARLGLSQAEERVRVEPYREASHQLLIEELGASHPQGALIGAPMAAASFAPWARDWTPPRLGVLP
jgi:DNA-binding SARP family transcriptional activator